MEKSDFRCPILIGSENDSNLVKGVSGWGGGCIAQKNKGLFYN